MFLKTNLFKQACDKWGINFQLDMVVEECSELIKAISKLKRNKGTLDELSEEIADVFITMSDVVQFFNLENKIKDVIRIKIKRLNKILKEE